MRLPTKLLFVTVLGGISVLLWRGLVAVMQGVTEMERNMGGIRQAVADHGRADTE